MMSRVYVEANFVLDLAYQRDRDSEQLLQFATIGRLKLAIPYTALWETQPVLERESVRFNRFAEDCRRMSKQLGGTRAGKEATTALLNAALSLEAFVDSVRDRVVEACARVEVAAEVISLTPEALCNATMLQLQFVMGERDAMALAAIIGHVSSSPAPWCCFYTKDRDHFGKDSVVEALKRSGVNEIYFRPGDVIRAVLQRD